MIDLRRLGLSYGAISSVLNAEGWPTPAGRLRWQRSYVDRLLHTRYAAEILGAEVDTTQLSVLLQATRDRPVREHADVEFVDDL